MIKSGVIAMQNLSGIVRTKREPREIKILTPPLFPILLIYIYFSLHLIYLFFSSFRPQAFLRPRGTTHSLPACSFLIPTVFLERRHTVRDGCEQEKKRVLLCCRQSPAHNGSLLFINAKREREPFPFQVKRGMRSALAHNTLSSCARSSWDYTVSTLDSYRETQMLP